MAAAATSALPVIRQLNSSITTISRPFLRSNKAEIGARMTIVRMAEPHNALFLFAPTVFDKATESEIEELGNNVQFIVCPDIEHHMYVGDYQKRWPDAVVIGVDGLDEKRKDIKFGKIFRGRGRDGDKVGYESEFGHVYFSAHKNKDVAFYHRPTKTLLEADLLFNLPPNEQYPGKKWSCGQRLIQKQLNAESGWQKIFIRYLVTQDKPIMSEDAREVAAMDFDRIVPCHGDVIETNGNAVWRNAYSWLL